MATARKRINSDNLIKIAVNSTAIYLFTFWLVYFVSQLITDFVAGTYGIPTGFKNFTVKFLLPDDSPLWNSDSIVTLYSIIPFTGIVLGLVFMVLYQNAKTRRGWFKVFSLWGAIHCSNLVFGSVILGVILQAKFGYALSWFPVQLGMQAVLVGVSILAMTWLSSLITLAFLGNATTHRSIDFPQRQFRFKVMIMFVPFLAGSIINFLLFFPDASLYGRLLNITMVFLLFGAFKNYNSNIQLVKERKNQMIAWGFILLTAGVIAAYFLWVYLF